MGAGGVVRCHPKIRALDLTPRTPRWFRLINELYINLLVKLI